MTSTVPKIEHPRLDNPRFKANPYPVYARLRAEAPVYRTKVAFWLPAIWVVTRYDDVVRILKDPRFSKDYIQAYPWIPPSIRAMFRNLLTVDPPDHTRLRSLVQKAFTPRLMEELRDLSIALYSFAADWVMISKMVRGTMDAGTGPG